MARLPSRSQFPRDRRGIESLLGVVSQRSARAREANIQICRDCGAAERAEAERSAKALQSFDNQLYVSFPRPASVQRHNTAIRSQMLRLSKSLTDFCSRPIAAEESVSLRKVALSAALVLLATGCIGGGELRPFIAYKPPFLPVKLVIDVAGVTMEGEASLVTPIGEFSIGAAVPAMRKSDDLRVIVRDRSHAIDRVFDIRWCDTLAVSINGRSNLQISRRVVFLDVSNGGRYELVVNAPNKPAATDARLFAVRGGASDSTKLTSSIPRLIGEFSTLLATQPAPNDAEPPTSQRWFIDYAEPFGDLTFSVDGARVTGSIYADRIDGGNLIEGTLDGSRIAFRRFSVAEQYWVGEIDATGNRIVGTFTWPGGSRAWTARKR